MKMRKRDLKPGARRKTLYAKESFHDLHGIFSLAHRDSMFRRFSFFIKLSVNRQVLK